MPADRPVPLATVQQMLKSRLSDVIAGMDPDEQLDLMRRATRACESWCDRRFAPFTGLVETHRAEGADMDELAEAGIGLPADLPTVVAASYGTALGSGAGSWVRRMWLRQRPPRYADLWSYGAIEITLIRSFGSEASLGANHLLGGGPDPETGQLWFRLGTFVPAGTRVRVRYSGGYHTIPGDLVEACMFMAAASAVDEDDYPGAAPSRNSHTSGGKDSGPDAGFLARARGLLEPYRRY